MSSESYNRNLFLPVLLPTLALTLVLSWNLYLGLQARNNGQQQIEQRQGLVEQSAGLQNHLEGLVNDVLILAEADRDAKVVVDKYQIRRNAAR